MFRMLSPGKKVESKCTSKDGFSPSSKSSKRCAAFAGRKRLFGVDSVNRVHDAELLRCGHLGALAGNADHNGKKEGHDDTNVRNFSRPQHHNFFFR